MWNDLKSARILLTGATGWLGQETLCAFQQREFSGSRLNILCSSKSTREFSVHKQKYLAHAFDSSIIEQEFDLIIHLACTLPKRNSELRLDDYEKINRNINTISKTLFSRNPKALKLILSSGIVDNPILENDRQELELYRSHKIHMENELLDKNTLVLRLWSITGHHIPVYSNYALREFIDKARLNRDINIRNNLTRTYVAAQDIMLGSLKFLLNGGRGVVNSGGEISSLEGLAQTITRLSSSSSEIFLNNSQLIPSLSYISPPTNLPFEVTRHFKDLDDQIRDLLDKYV